MVKTRAELHVLTAHVQGLVSKLLMADHEKTIEQVGFDLQAAGLVCLGEQDLVDILTLDEKAVLARLKLKYKN